MSFGIQSGKFNGLTRCFHHNPAPGQIVKIKGVQGLSGFHHHIIGDIHYIVDGSQTHRFQPGLKPVGRGADFNVKEHAGRISGTKFRILDFHPGKVMDGIGNNPVRRQFSFRKSDAGLGIEKCAGFPGHTDQAQAVRPVGSQVNFQYGIIQPQGLF